MGLQDLHKVLSIDLQCINATSSQIIRVLERFPKAAIGNCRLNKPTGKDILPVAYWDVVELGEDVEGPLDLMPRVWGRLRKKSEI